MSVLAEQHGRHQLARSRLWGAPPRRPVIVPLPPMLRFNTDEPETLPVFVPFNFLKAPSAHAIIKLVGLKRGVTVQDILGSSRAQRVVPARHEAMWLVHTHCRSLSLLDVGRVFRRDHTTVLYALAKYTGKRRRADG